MSNDETDQKVKAIAQKVLNNVDQKDDNCGFVITILMIISITLTLIRIIQECNKKISVSSSTEKCEYFKSEIKQRLLKPSWFTKMMIKKAIRNEIGRDNYKTYGVSIMNAILTVGDNLTDDEIQTLVEAANV